MTDILNYIPQRPPFVMIDTVVKADEAVSETLFTIPEDHLFVDAGHFTEPGLVENMAQTAAVSAGYNAYHSGVSAPVGFIGALKNLAVFQLPRVNSTITTTVHFDMQVMNAQIVTATIQQNGMLIASCELKIFLQQ